MNQTQHFKLTAAQFTIQKKWRNSKIKISREIRDMIHGYMMSDGSLTPNGCLQVENCREQAKFVEWLYEKLEHIRTQTPITEIARVDKRTQKQTFSKRFYTKALLKGFRHMWYKPDPNLKKDGSMKLIKTLPKSLNCFFNATMLTLWFAGVGTKIIGSRGAKFEATCFTPEERQRLKKLFKEKYGMEVSLNRAGVSRAGNTQWTICINSADYDQFRNLITQLDLIPRVFPQKLHKKKL